MKKEKASKIYKKPELSLICPPKMLTNHLTPQLILTQYQNPKQILQNSEHCSVQLKPILNFNISRMQSITCSQFYKPIQRNEYLQKQSRLLFKIEKEEAQKIEQRKTQSFIKRKKSNEHRRLVCKNSPYVKNKEDYQRILNSLKPIKGPTDSLISQIKRHNQLHRKNAQNILLATNQSFKDKISKYSSRIGLKNNEKIFVMNSKDVHIRDALVKNGWIQSLDWTTNFYHLKWVYTDRVSDYAKLQQGQFYNHFLNNRELTNKNLFRKNVYKSPRYLQPSYPATFDIQSSEGQTQFENQYTKYQYYKMLDRLNTFIQINCSDKIQKMKKLNIFQSYSQIHINCEDFIAKDLCTSIKLRWFYKQKVASSRQLRQVIYQFCFLSQQFAQIQKIAHENKKSYLVRNICEVNYILRNISHFMAKISAKRNSIKVNIPQSSMSKYSVEQDEYKQVYTEKKSNNQNQNDIFESQLQKNQQLQNISQTGKRALKNITLQNTKQMKQQQLLLSILQNDRFLMFYFMFLAKKAKAKYEFNFGLKNWWIVKPVGISRGLGIKIQSDICKIINNKHGKIVQKYIQQPLILKCGRKFDIRQWVLVRSFLPLQVYIFEKCYCRFSASKYSANNTDNLQIHLTNYSQQKKFYKNSQLSQQSSILSENDLQLQIDESTYSGKWQKIKSSIKKQIIKSLKCCQLEIQNHGSCFQVYGFDIMLDKQYQPWIIQINMSPACEKRGLFLEKYLSDMALGIIDLLEYKDELFAWQKLDINKIQLEIQKGSEKGSQKDSKIRKLRNLNAKIENQSRLNEQSAAIIIQKQYRKWKNQIRKLSKK